MDGGVEEYALRVFSWHGLDLSVDHPLTDFKIAFYLSIKILLKRKKFVGKILKKHPKMTQK